MGVEGNNLDRILQDFIPKESVTVQINKTECKIFKQDSNSWNVYIENYSITVTQQSDGSLIADDTSSFSATEAHSQEHCRIAVQAVHFLLSNQASA